MAIIIRFRAAHSEVAKPQLSSQQASEQALAQCLSKQSLSSNQQMGEQETSQKFRFDFD